MLYPLNIAAVVSLLAAAIGFVFGAIWWRISRAPGWHTMRPFAFVALSAGGYCLLDTAPVLPLPVDLVYWATQGSLALGALHAFAWVRWVYAVQDRPLDGPARFWLGGSLVVATLAMIPGVMLNRQDGTFVVPALDVTYRVFEPTALGLFGYLFFLAALWFLGWRSFAQWHLGVRERLPAFAAMAMTVVAVHDTLATAQIIHTPFLTDFAFLIIIVAFGLLYLGRFAEDSERLQTLRHRLEDLVTERTAEVETAQYELAKERTVAAVGRLAGGVSHEINNPATVISVNVGLLRDELAERGALQGAVRELLDETRGALHRIIEIVTDLRLSAGTIEPVAGTRSESDMRLCVERAIALVSERGLPTANIEFAVPRELRVRGDRTAVTRLLAELVANATIAASSARGTEGAVSVQAVPTNQRVVVRIRDNGQGVPAEVQSALFEPFSGNVGIAGRGLGLAVVRGLARQLHASLRLEDNSSAGATFVVEFATPA